MGSDNEIAVVFHKGRWYVACIFDGNWERAIVHGQSFKSKDDALVFASNLNTEYGIRVYENVFEVYINEYLEKYGKDNQNKFWKEDSKEYNSRKEELKQLLASYSRKDELKQLLASHGVELRDDSKICQAYISGGLPKVIRLTDNRLQTIDDIIMTIVEISFLCTKTKYAKFIRGATNKTYIEQMKNDALIEYVSRHPKLLHVPELLRPKLEKLRRHGGFPVN
jgi:hypothetical protein